MIAAYKRLPKLVRFCLFYGTSVVWFPIFLVLGCAFLFIYNVVDAAVSSWRDFK